MILLGYLVAQFVGAILVGIVIGIFHAFSHLGHPANTEAMQSVILLPAVVTGMLLGGLTIYFMFKKTFPGEHWPAGLRAIGWGPARGKDVVLAAGAGVILALFYFFLVVASSPAGTHHVPTPLNAAGLTAGWRRNMLAFSAIVLAPPIEEFLFRGILFAAFARTRRLLRAGSMVTAIFLLAHITEIAGNWPAIVTIGGLSVAAIVARLRTGSLFPSIALHTAYNSCMMAVLYIALP